MRVPIPLAILLSLAVIGVVWWRGTRHTDFLTPPPASKLEEVRAKVASSLPPADHPDDAIAVPSAEKATSPPLPEEEPKPAIALGDLSRPPALQEYAELAPKGAAYLADVAVLLETEGENQRALLAWERILDMGKPDETQSTAAITAIKRLRPTLPNWNTDPTKAIAITLQAGTGKKTAKLLKPLLEQAARNLEQASVGILKVTPIVTAGRDNSKAKGPAPVALWLAGPAKDARSTEVLSFTVESPESLKNELCKTAFFVIRSYLGRMAGRGTPPPLADGTDPLEALNTQVTRLNWHDLGTTLNRPPEKNE